MHLGEEVSHCDIESSQCTSAVVVATTFCSVALLLDVRVDFFALTTNDD